MTPNLYEIYYLDPSADSETLKAEMLIQSARFSYGSKEARRAAWASDIFSDEKKRVVYDSLIGAQATWADIEHLAIFGTLAIGRQEQVRQRPPEANVFNDPGMHSNSGMHWTKTQTSAGANPMNPFAAQPVGGAIQNQPPLHMASQPVFSPGVEKNGGKRISASIIDLFIFSAAAGLLGFSFEIEGVISALVATILATLYIVGFEVYAGATPGKMLLGLRVTGDGEKPTAKESVMRNWWKLFFYTLPPVTVIAGLIYARKLDDPQGAWQDNFAGTQVIRK
ncbi:hypothetical membrane protein [Corynebacterium kutscheri]|uniref:Putative membrane protein/domain n=1 Tax=Corynebacterium kutscheri TaxID=35755 RepID=A0A0F6TEQ4_9CORY|nr:RDD family protein [Corynebacterium kutscheri]AKE41974.1 putative membrane protein/domain [Corynebacterium kutscheri]VEH10315.1 hypothetical membrane protein [Corynebacterium kutscheri]VEH82160.1 hypothetical membrane protein [Corynebacterium kutscheri]